MNKWLHRIATVACTVGAVVAPALATTTLFALGPITVTGGALIGGGLALAAAAGIAPSPVLQKIIEGMKKK